jgi:CRISPR-associated protein Csb2
MTVIECTFPTGGRLHATPWGRHVNEGATEWPISPWRIQRALVATWYLKARQDIEQPRIVSLMEALAGEAPSFQLPPAVQSHTRHYMPGRGTDKPKVFDTFIHTSQHLRVQWPVDLDEDLRSALDLLCQRLTYLGRAESIVQATLLPPGASFTPNCRPLLNESEPGPQEELVRVLCPETPTSLAQLLQANPTTPSSTKVKKGKAKASAASLPTTIFDALLAETATLQAQGWLIPPGSRWVDYCRPVDCFEPKSLRPKRQRSKPVTVARFAISSTVLPRITQAISIAERLHQKLVKLADGKACAPIFTGLGPEAQPLSGHRHTHIFCELGEKRDTIGYLTLYAPDGYTHEAQEVLEDVQRKALWGHGGHDLDLVLLGFGQVSDFDIPIFGKSKRWTSLTPFVPTRHAKHYADGRPKLDADGWPIGSPAQDLRRLLKEDYGLIPKFISPPDTKIPVRPQRTLRTLQFQTQRHHGHGKRSHQPAVSLTIEFEQEIQGPLALGYGSHFGLGLFVPV